MSSDDIQAMFRLLTETESLPPDDPRRAEFEAAANGLKAKYMGEVLGTPEPEPEWVKALMYTKGLFEKAAQFESESKLSRYWTLIAGAVGGYYAMKEKELSGKKEGGNGGECQVPQDEP